MKYTVEWCKKVYILWRASFDTGYCFAWNRMGHKEFYMRSTRLAWITYELKLHQHLPFEIVICFDLYV
jgi:hypothetical protein